MRSLSEFVRTVLVPVVMVLGMLTAGTQSAGASPALATVAVSTFASLNSIDSQGITTDSLGNFYIVNNAGQLWWIAASDPTRTPVLLATGAAFASAEQIVYNNGYLYISDWSTTPGDVWKVSLDGTATSVYATIPTNPEGMVFDSAGNLYVASGTDHTIFKVAPGGGAGTDIGVTGIPLGSGPGSSYPWGLTLVDTTLYFVDNHFGIIYSVPTSGGAATPIFSDANYSALSHLYADPAGNIFAPVAGSGSSPGAIVEIPAGTNTAVVLTSTGVALPNNLGGGITWYQGNIYFEDNFYHSPSNILMFADPIATAPTNLLLSSTTSSIAASWAASPFASNYTCTILYGFNNASSFSVTTSTTSCYLTGLAAGSSYGVSVVANSGNYASPPVVGFTTTASPAPILTHSPAKLTLICVKGRVVRRVTSVNPSCPRGFRIKG